MSEVHDIGNEPCKTQGVTQESKTGDEVDEDEFLSLNASAKLIGRHRDWIRTRIANGSLNSSMVDNEFRINRTELLSLEGATIATASGSGGEAGESQPVVVDLRGHLDPDEASLMAEALAEFEERLQLRSQVALLSEQLTHQAELAAERESRAEERINQLEAKVKREAADAEFWKGEHSQLEASMNQAVAAQTLAETATAAAEAQAEAIREERDRLVAAREAAAKRADQAEAVMGWWAKRKLAKLERPDESGGETTPES